MRVIVMGYRRGRYFPLSVMTALSLLLAAVGDYLYEHVGCVCGRYYNNVKRCNINMLFEWDTFSCFVLFSLA